MLALPPATPIDYPFADSDVAQLQRVTASPDSFALDDQTWHDLLLAPYLATLTGAKRSRRQAGSAGTGCCRRRCSDRSPR